MKGKHKPNKLFSLFLGFAFLSVAQAQNVVDVSGFVTDSVGKSLSGVSVIVKNNTSIGTTTDANGGFILKAPRTAVLQFSLVGFLPAEIAVAGNETIKLALLEDISSIEEVVVVGFGKQKRTDMVGSVVSVRPTDLKVPSSNLTTALAGRVAGMIAYQRSGEPGEDNAEFFIRGVTTFGYSRSPLILIDNIEVTTRDLARLQVDDIASFSVMKDATATAIYGARGANGIILITTKEGAEGETKLSFRIENSFSSPTKEIELADPITYMRLHNESINTRDSLGRSIYSREEIDRREAGEISEFYPVTDWKKELLRNVASNQRVNLNVSGGGKFARYFVSGGAAMDNGILKVDNRNNFNTNIDLKTYNLRSNVNMNLTKTTELLVRLHGSFDDYVGPINGGAKVYLDIMRTSPVLFPAYYSPSGDFSHVKHIMFGNSMQGNYVNPYADMVRGYTEYSRSEMLAQVELKQKLNFLTEGLSFRSMINTSRHGFFQIYRSYNPFYYALQGYNKNTGVFNLELLNENSGTEYLGYGEGGKILSSVFYLESAMDYNRTFNTKHTVNGLLVHILRQSLNANAGDLQLSLPFRNVGLSGRFSYAYDSKYFLEFNFGYNGSERFHESNRFGYFPSFGAAWTVSNESFWKPLKSTLTNLRVRGTYGIVGNDAIGSPNDRFFYLSNVLMQDWSKGFSFGRRGDNAQPGISINRYANERISWEKAYKSNVALEIGLFDKLQIQADLFHERRTNILMDRHNISSTMGLNAPLRANVGIATSKGMDLSAEYTHSLDNGLWIQSRLNFSYATSKMVENEEPQYSESYLSRKGYSLSQQWGYLAERLFIDDAEVRNSPAQPWGKYMAGDIKYRDVNDDGYLTGLDVVPIGYPTVPEIVYGFGFSSGFKGFDLSAFFQGLSRESFWIDPGATAPFGSYNHNGDDGTKIYQNQLLNAYASDHWSEENRNMYALWPRLSATRLPNNEVLSTWFLRNGSFLRLKQVEVGYTLSDKLMEKLKIQRCRIYGSGTNLLSLTNFKLWDVEMAGNGLGYPLQRVFNLGVQLNF